MTRLSHAVAGGEVRRTSPPALLLKVGIKTCSGSELRIDSVGIQNFRCLQAVGIGFDEITAFIGPNGAERSTVLRALDWFFNGATLRKPMSTQAPALIAVSVFG